MNKFKHALRDAWGSDVPNILTLVFVMIGGIASVARVSVLKADASIEEVFRAIVPVLFGAGYATVLLVSVAYCLLPEATRRVRLADLDSFGRVFHPLGWHNLCSLIVASLTASFLVGLWFGPIYSFALAPACFGVLWVVYRVCLSVLYMWCDDYIRWTEERNLGKWGD